MAMPKCVHGLGLDANVKDSLIYELELAASIVAMKLWGRDSCDNLQVCYGDNDSARFSLIRASATGNVAPAFMKRHLQWEAEANYLTWFAKVPTEANIADHPSRCQKLEMQCLRSSCLG